MRSSQFQHLIFWESDVKNVHLDEHTIKRIFERLYEGDPQSIAQDFYNRIAVREEWETKDALKPLLFKDNRDQIREVITNAIQESNTQ